MRDIVASFGSWVQSTCEKDPVKARRWLALGYQAKELQIRHDPRLKDSPAARMVAAQTMRAMTLPLVHPERSAMASLFLPCEPLQVMGLYPYSCEGLGCFLSGTQAEQSFLQYAESQGLPDTFCSYHRVFIGAAEKGLMPKPQFILNTTLACDANLLTFRRLAKYFQVPQFVVDVPYETDDQAINYVADQLREMVRFMAQMGSEDPEMLKSFSRLNYVFTPEYSDHTRYVFLRSREHRAEGG